MLKNFNQINTHPIDARIRFVDKDHKYYIDEERNKISVTGFIDLFYEPFDKNKSAFLASRNKNGEYYGKSKDEIIKMWEDIAQSGSNIHKAIDEYLQGNKTYTPPPNAFLEYMKTHPTWEPYRTEWSIFDEDTKLPGQLDAIFKDGDRLILVDWKNTKEITTEGYQGKCGTHELTKDLFDCKYEKYRLQVNIYRHILKKNYAIDISEMYIANFPPKYAKENRYDEYRVEYLDITPYFEWYKRL